MSSEAIVSAPLRGATRTIDTMYPDSAGDTIGGTNNAITTIDRQTPVNVNGSWGGAGQGVPPSPRGYMIYRGRACFSYRAAAANVLSANNNQQLAIIFPTKRPASRLNGLAIDPCSCWSVKAIMAFDRGPDGVRSGEYGLEVTAQGAAGALPIITNANQGFLVGPTSPTAVSLRVRGANNVFPTITGTVDPTVIGGFDYTDWNVYELRFIGATFSNEAFCRFMVNGKQIGAWSWGPGVVILPPIGYAAGSIGWGVAVGNRATNDACYLSKPGVSIVAAPSEAALL
jgi:hypothetical protein